MEARNEFENMVYQCLESARAAENPTMEQAILRERVWLESNPSPSVALLQEKKAQLNRLVRGF